MTSQPPPSPGDSPPPRSNPGQGVPPGRQTEINLWDLDEPVADQPGGTGPDAPDTPIAPAGPAAPAPHTGQQIDPKPRDWKASPPPTGPAGDPMTHAAHRSAKPERNPRKSKTFSDFDDLDADESSEPVPADWQQEPTDRPNRDHPSTTPSHETAGDDAALMWEAEPEDPDPFDQSHHPLTAADDTPVVAPDPGTAAEGAPPATPSQATASDRLKAAFQLSPLEKIGLAAFLAIFLIGSGMILVHWLGRIPTTDPKDLAPDFPVKGERITAISAETYWREPITTGDNPDRFRRGTRLLPVADLKLSGGPGAIRVFFRNGEDKPVGDTITLSVNGDASVSVAATGGLEDLGMHAAYQTGGTDPWAIEVFEGPSVNASSAGFKLLFRSSISSDRR